MAIHAVAGVDPGKSGAIALLSPDSEVIDCATMDDLSELYRVLNHCQLLDAYVWVEKVHAMPKQGVVSMFNFGAYYGMVQGALGVLGVRWELVLPRAWMRGLGIPPKKKTETRPQFKRRLREEARRRFPKEKVTLATADALLIAEQCRRTVLKS